MRPLIVAILLSVFGFLPTERLVAQPNWSVVPLPNIYIRITPYFLNPNVGFVFDGTGIVQSNLRKTTDGGITWVAILSFDQANIFIKQLYFLTLLKGFAATSNGVFETTDGGITWQKIDNTTLPFNSVYAFGNRVFAYANDQMGINNWGPLITSTDDGATWDTVLPPSNYGVTVDNAMAPYVFGNKDSIVYAQNIISNNMEMVYSTNNGRDWKHVDLDKSDKTFTMGLFAYSHSTDLVRTFIAPKDIGGDDVYLIVHSSDFGKSWDTIHRAIEIGAWIAGSACDIYSTDALGSQASPKKNGFWASRDRGQNWSYVSGPNGTEIDDDDFHNLSVVGGGAVLYDGEIGKSRNDLWRSTNGGDGFRSFTAPGSVIQFAHDLSTGGIDTLSVAACDTGIVGLYLQNSACSIYAQIQGVTIDGLAPSDYSVVLARHHLLSESTFDTVLVAVHPSVAQTKDLTMHLHFINDEFFSFDTSFTFTLKFVPGPNTVIYQKVANTFAGSGDTIDIPLYINSATPMTKKAYIDSLDVRYSLHTDLIEPIAFVPMAKGVTTTNFKTATDASSVMIHLASDFSFTGETEIGALRVKGFVTDTLESDIVMDGLVHGTGCQTILSDSVISFHLGQRCGDSLLSKFIHLGSADLLKSICPNPAQNWVEIDLRTGNLSAEFELFDLLGAMRKRGSILHGPFHLDVSDLSGGNYYLRIRTSDGRVSSERVLIDR